MAIKTERGEAGYVLSGIRPFVCMQLHIKTLDQVFVKILPEMYLWTGSHH